VCDAAGQGHLVKEAAVGDPIHAGAPWRVTRATNTAVADVAGGRFTVVA